jgi:hypothetical protein
MSGTYTTNPSPIIEYSPATLTYSNSSVIVFPGDTYQLKTSSGTILSSVVPNLTENTIASNLGYYSSAYSFCLYYGGNIYTSMQSSPGGSNVGFIQKTTTGASPVSSNYFQFVLTGNNSTNVPPGNPNGPVSFPTGLSIDDTGNLYFLVYGNNNIFKITNLSSPLTNYSQFNTTNSTISAPYDMALNPSTNYLYISSTNPPRVIEKIDTNGITSTLSGYSGTGPTYGLCIDGNNTLYIGFAGGVIGKYNLSTNVFTQNFVTLSGESGNVTGLVYVSSKNIIIANVSGTNNIYAVSLTGIYNNLISNSGIIGGFGTDGTNIYGTTSSQIIQYTLPTTIVFSNLTLTTSVNSNISVINSSTSTTIDTININNVNPPTGLYNSSGQDLAELFKPINLNSSSPAALTNYNVNLNSLNLDLNAIFSTQGTINSSNTTGFVVKNYNNTGLNKDVSSIFAAANT